MAAGALIVALALVWFLEMETRRTLPEKEDKAGVTYGEYREYCREISLLIFRDHPLAGVGPGMYGGHISLKYGSPVYAAYGFDGRHLRYLSERVGSIEQQWAQTLAETGAVGLGLLLVLIFTPAYILYRLRRREKDLFVRALMKALMVMPFLLIVYMFGFTVMQQRIWLVPYYIFAGALTGCRRRTETGPLNGPGGKKPA
jgi:O-antigen ligase